MAKRKRAPKKKVLPLAVILVGLFLILFALYFFNRDSTPQLPQPPLKDLAAKHGIELGNFAIEKRLNEKPYANILASQFDLALVDNVGNWHFTDADLRPSPTTYNFSHIDKVVNFAQAHDMQLQFHHFLWGEEKWLPGWLKNGNYNKQQLLNLIHDHINTVGKRYNGKIGEWVVVNEAFTRNLHTFGLHDWWADHVGDMSYIDQAYIWAHQVDPNAKLILNDFDNEGENNVSDAMYTYIKGAKARGIPIDAIGMQMHIDGTHPPTKDEVIANMKRFGDLGVKVYVTEFDVNMHDVKASDTDKAQTEANIYYDMMRACIESKVCPSFSILGITDKETWYNYLNLSGAMPLPFDEHYKPKPAYYSLRNALLESSP
jgi:endo-1,4-beta-xylanase